MTAQLQQRSIYDWAQSEHQSAASRTGVVVATRSHIILMLPCRRSSHGVVTWACGCSPSAWGRTIAGSWNLSRRVSIDKSPMLSWVFPDFLG